jgi:hypothetical protein
MLYPHLSHETPSEIKSSMYFDMENIFRKICDYESIYLATFKWDIFLKSEEHMLLKHQNDIAVTPCTFW